VLTFAETVGGSAGVGMVELREAARRWTREQLAVGTGIIAIDLHDRLLAVIEPVLLGETLAAMDGNQIRAAATLGMNRNTLRKKLTHYDIDPAMPLRES